MTSSLPVRPVRRPSASPASSTGNCDRAALFLNGESLATMRRDSQNFPAAGLRWEVVFARGPNHLRAIATKGHVTVQDELYLTYQTEPWGTPVQLKLSQKRHKDNIVTVEAKLYDAKSVLCLESAQNVRFSLSGAGNLIDNLGTTWGSREVQLSNGRAEISVVRKGACRIEAVAKGLPAATLEL